MTDQTLPICLKSAFVDVLSSTNTKYATAFTSARCSAVALATFLHCPLLATGSDFYFMIPQLDRTVRPESNIDLIYAPLEQNIDALASFSHDDFTSDSTLIVFHSNANGLHKVSEFHRPLVACFFSINPSSRLKLPEPLNSKMERTRSGLTKNSDMNMLIDWLSTFNPTSLEPFHQMLLSNAESRDSNIVHQIVSVMNTFVYDPFMDGRLLASKLNLNPGSSTKISDLPLISFADTDYPSSNVDLLPFLTFLKTQNVKCHSRPDFIVGWPLNLIKAYQEAKFSPSILIPLYFAESILLPEVTKFDDDVPFSVHDVCLPIRLYQYRLFVGLEHRLNKVCKLRGADPKVVEYVRRGKRLLKYELVVKPLVLAPDFQHSDAVLCSLLGIPFPGQVPNPDWLFGLAVTLAFWFQQSDEFKNCGGKIPFDESPIGLAITACAVANISNIDYMDKELCNHYERFSNYVEKEIYTLKQRTSPETKPSDMFEVHHSNERTMNYLSIQALYSSLRSLNTIIDCLLPINKQSSLFRFLPSWIIFPSGRLFNCLSAHLENQLPSIRLNQITTFWIPRLYRARGRHSLFSAEITNMVDIFKRLVNIINILCRSPLKPTDIDFSVKEVPSKERTSSSGDYVPESKMDWKRGDIIHNNSKNVSNATWIRGRSTIPISERQPLKEFPFNHNIM